MAINGLSSRRRFAAELYAVAAVCLGLVKRMVGLFDEALDLSPVLRCQCDVDADGDLSSLIVSVNGLFDTASFYRW